MMTFASIGRLWAKIVTLLVIGLTLGGCWDNRPVDYRALIFTIGFSPGPKPGELKMLFQFPTPPAMAQYSKGSGASGSSPVGNVTGEGPSVARCFNGAQAQVSRDLYLGQIQIVAVSTKLSAPLFYSSLNSLERTGTFDKMPFMFATAQPLKKVASFHTTQNNFPSLYYVDLFSCMHCQTDSLGVRFWQFASDVATPGVDPYLPQVSLASKPNHVLVNRVALYRHLTYVSTLSPQNTMTFGILKGLAHKVSLFLPRQQATLRAIHGSSRLQVQDRHGHISAMFHVVLSSTLEGIGTQTETAAQLALLSHEGSEILARRCLTLLEKTQKLDVDPFGVGRNLDWHHPESFLAIKHWHKEYPKVHMTVHVQLKIHKMGDLK